MLRGKKHLAYSSKKCSKNGSTTSILKELHPTYHTTGEYPPGNDHISPIPAGTIESMIFLLPFGGTYDLYDCSLESAPFISNNTSFLLVHANARVDRLGYRVL